MIQTLQAPITVYSLYNHKISKVLPVKLQWDGHDYSVKRLGLHYTYKEGKTLYHVFTVTCETLSFKLVLNTDNLFWEVEQISDGIAD